MSKNIWLEAKLPPDADIERLWHDIPHNNTHLGGKNGMYTVTYQGDLHEGVGVLEQLLATDGIVVIHGVCGG